MTGKARKNARKNAGFASPPGGASSRMLSSAAWAVQPSGIRAVSKAPACCPLKGTNPPSRDEGDEVALALRELPPRMRAVLVLRYWFDLDVTTIARQMGCTTATVRSRRLDRRFGDRSHRPGRPRASGPLVTIVVLIAAAEGLRGHLTRWMIDVAAGVSVGNPSARVRDRVWSVLANRIDDGQAVMIESVNRSGVSGDLIF